MRDLFQWVSALRRFAVTPIVPAALALLWGKPERFAFRWGDAHDARHPFRHLGEPVHPDDIASLAGLLPYDLLDRERIIHDKQFPGHSARSILTVGGPAADDLTRVVFEYHGETPDRLRRGDKALQLPFTWISHVDDVRGSIKKPVRGRRSFARPNWSIQAGRHVYEPRADRAGLQLDDYLIVTRIRNFIDPVAFEHGEFILSFAGAHGSGTRAASLLVRSEALIEDVSRGLKQVSEFQLLLRAGDIAWGEVEPGPRDLELIGLAPLDISEDKYMELRERCVPRLQAVFGLV